MENALDFTTIIDTNASSSAFGWDFQSNAAILLALKNIKDLKSLKVEGSIEDIELHLIENNKNIYVQAKSQEDPSSSTNTLSKLQEGIKTLINATNQKEYEKLIYISNIMNPLKDKNLDYYWGNYFTIYSYAELNEQAKNIIDKYTNSAVKKYNLNISNLDSNKLQICTFPFFGENDETRYRIIIDTVKQFLGSANVNEGIAHDLLNYWQSIFFQNASRHIELIKEELVWPIVVLEASVVDENFLDNYDIGQIEEIKRKYLLFINKKSEQFEFVNLVTNHFIEFQKANRNLKPKETFATFIDTQWNIYNSLIINDFVEPDVMEGVTKLVIIQILKIRFSIDNLKKAAGL